VKGTIPNETQAEALNDDINVTAICDLHTSLSFPPMFHVFQYFDFHEANRLTRNEGTGGRSSTEGGETSLNIEFPISQTRLLNNLCITQSAFFRNSLDV
jgi:hypothetical protein